MRDAESDFFETPDVSDSLRYLNIEFRGSGVVELDEDLRSALASVPRAEIKSIHAESGFKAERLAGEITVGLLFTLAGLYLFMSPNGLPSALGFIAALGIVIIRHALRRGTYLAIETTRSARKLSFRGKPDPANLEEFIKSARQKFGYG